LIGDNEIALEKKLGFLLVYIYSQNPESLSIESDQRERRKLTMVASYRYRFPTLVRDSHFNTFPFPVCTAKSVGRSKQIQASAAYAQQHPYFAVHFMEIT